MATTSIIELTTPDSTDRQLVSVFYDGDDVGMRLGELIARDGYPTVFTTLTSQPSRNWRELDPAATDQLPDYITRIPENADTHSAVAGYGVLLVGADEITADKIGTWNPDTARDRQYRVHADGTIHTLR